MHLKSLTLRGFKSFATSTTLRFEPGINAIVGPNGSGKSNVVDALAWVMGEQGAKSLRGSAMSDIIFAGTSNRPALGRAEVSLTIDNADGALPIEYSEVTISRTLFREGGSEYAINGNQVRLLDIQELLSDTGMGREMHVIIGQGRLDQVLTATPEERRGIIEEAAGVLKHRRRQQKALHKLDSMKATFDRLEDLSKELRRQLGPLARQAKAARRAGIVQATVRDAKARLLADDIAQAQARLDAGQADAAKLARERTALTAALEAVRTEIAGLEDEAARMAPELSDLISASERLSSLEERFRSLANLAAEREHSLRARGAEGAQREDPAELERRAREARDEEETLRRRTEEATDALSAAQSAREEAERGERAAERRHADLSRSLADQREDAARLAGKIASATSRLEALDDEAKRVTAEQTAAGQRAVEAAARVTALEEEAAARGDDESGTAAHEASSRQLAQATQALRAAREAAGAARENVARLRATADTLKLSLAPEDASAWAVSRGATPVSEAIVAKRGWESAVETALGGAASGVSAGLETAVDLLRAAVAEAAGHLEITVTDQKPGTEVESRQAAAAENAGDAALQAALAEVGAGDAARPALDAVHLSGPAAPALRAMLRGTAVAEDLVTARRLIEHGAPAVATKDGALLTRTRVSGGEASAASLLARRTALDDATKELADAEADAALAASRLEDAHMAEESARAAFDRTGAELAARDAAAAAATAELGAARQSLAAAKKNEERSASRLAAIATDRARRVAELDSLRASQQAEVDPEAGAAELKELDSQRTRAAESSRVARKAETDARLALRTAEERLRGVVGRADSLDRAAQRARERKEREEREAAHRKHTLASLTRIGTLAGRALAASTALREDTQRRRAATTERRTQQDAALTMKRRALTDLEEKRRGLDDSAHQRELARATHQLRFEQLAARAAEELGTDADALVAEFGPLCEVPQEDGTARPYVRAEQERRLATAQRELDKLGRINPLALEEQAALEERNKYLSEQLADLKQTRADLLGIVRDIDDRVEHIMKAALADVSQQFERVFGVLFPGGRGRLVFTDPDSVLTTGVEIEARPPGKRVKRLSLLSGGERSLTAIAFLVATFIARPSPFYVMDEVEAALDDVNLTRLLRIFRELQETSQLLVITHQKRTMETADTIYGVSMREDGVSTVVSQRLSELRKEEVR